MTSRFKINNPRHKRLYSKESTLTTIGHPGILNPSGKQGMHYASSNYAIVIIVLFSCILSMLIVNHLSTQVNQDFWIKKIILKNRQVRNSERAALYALPKEDKALFLENYRLLISGQELQQQEYQNIIASFSKILENRPRNIIVNRTLANTLFQVCEKYGKLCLNSRDYISYTLYLKDYDDNELCDKLYKLDREILTTRI